MKICYFCLLLDNKFHIFLEQKINTFSYLIQSTRNIEQEKSNIKVFTDSDLSFLVVVA